MEDIDIFDEWIEKSLAKHIITENAQAAAVIEFAKYYHNKKLILSGVSNSTKVNRPKLSVKCLHCGRNFIGKMHHKCNTGYRKRNHSWQEITED